MAKRSLALKRIHISPVGFEIDRIVEPAKMDNADLVYLISHDNLSTDKAKPYVKAIIKRLKSEEGIEAVEKRVNRMDLFEIIKVVKDIIFEHREEAQIFINVASGSKIHAIGCMIACMMFDDNKNIVPFYAVPEKYQTFEDLEQQTEGLDSVLPLPLYRIRTPDNELLEVLGIIKDMISKSRNGKITKKDLANVLIDKKIIELKGDVLNHKMAQYTTLDKKIIKPLKDKWEFIDEEKVGRNRRIFFTQDGLDASKFLF
jgi:hypothetical protein